jgi:hypothetical protein
VISPALVEADQALMSTLDAITIDDLHQRARQAGVGTDNDTGIDFTI